jgi:hypothetical protein
VTGAANRAPFFEMQKLADADKALQQKSRSVAAML